MSDRTDCEDVLRSPLAPMIDLRRPLPKPAMRGSIWLSDAGYFLIFF